MKLLALRLNIWHLLCLLVLVLVPTHKVAADDACLVQVDSYFDEALDAKVLLPRVELGKEEKAPYRSFKHATATQYKNHALPYSEFHQRILIEPRLSVTTPDILISSIGLPNQSSLTILLEAKRENGENSREDVFIDFFQCEIVLQDKPQVEPLRVKEKDLSSAEIIARLLEGLGTFHGVSAVETMAAMLRLEKGVPLQANQKMLILNLDNGIVDQRFANGLMQIMTEKEQEAFKTNLEKGAGFAVVQALFVAKDRGVLTRLLSLGVQDLNRSKQQEYAKMDHAELVQALTSMQNFLIQTQGEMALTQGQVRPIIAAEDQQDWVIQLKKWLLLRNFWLVLSGLFLFLFLWLTVRIVLQAKHSQ